MKRKMERIIDKFIEWGQVIIWALSLSLFVELAKTKINESICLLIILIIAIIRRILLRKLKQKNKNRHSQKYIRSIYTK